MVVLSVTGVVHIHFCVAISWSALLTTFRVTLFNDGYNAVNSRLNWCDVDVFVVGFVTAWVGLYSAVLLSHVTHSILCRRTFPSNAYALRTRLK